MSDLKRSAKIVKLYQINCRFNINLKTKDKVASRVIKRMGAQKIGKQAIEEYDKFSGTHMTSFEFNLEASNNQEIVYQILQLSHSLAKSSWSVSGPYDQGSLLFECYLNNSDEHDVLRWASISIVEAR